MYVHPPRRHDGLADADAGRHPRLSPSGSGHCSRARRDPIRRLAACRTPRAYGLGPRTISHDGHQQRTHTFLRRHRCLPPKRHRSRGQRVRRPENTRPQALKNSDCKTAAATINYPIRNTMTEWTVERQRGFVATRGPLQHVARLQEWDGASDRQDSDTDTIREQPTTPTPTDQPGPNSDRRHSATRPCAGRRRRGYDDEATPLAAKPAAPTDGAGPRLATRRRRRRQRRTERATRPGNVLPITPRRQYDAGNDAALTMRRPATRRTTQHTATTSGHDATTEPAPPKRETELRDVAIPRRATSHTTRRLFTPPCATRTRRSSPAHPTHTPPPKTTGHGAHAPPRHAPTPHELPPRHATRRTTTRRPITRHVIEPAGAAIVGQLGAFLELMQETIRR